MRWLDHEKISRIIFAVTRNYETVRLSPVSYQFPRAEQGDYGAQSYFRFKNVIHQMVFRKKEWLSNNSAISSSICPCQFHRV